MKSRYILAGFLVILILVAAVLILKKSNKPSLLPQAGAQNITDTKIKGPANAPVRMIEYSDFQCPACKLAEGVIENLMNDPEYQGKIQFVYRHFPLSGHKWAGAAHQAAECANQAGKFWEYHHLLYRDQERWPVEPNPVEVFLRYAKELNLPPDAFMLCLANPQVQASIMGEKKSGLDLKIGSTPTFFINGERFVGPFELHTGGRAVIRKILGLPTQPAPALPVPAAPVHDHSAHSTPAAPASAFTAAVSTPAPGASPKA